MRPDREDGALVAWHDRRARRRARTWRLWVALCLGGLSARLVLLLVSS